MKVKLVGVRKLDFNTDDGKNMKGTQLFFTYADDGITGMATDKKFIQRDEVFQINPFDFINKDIDIEFGRKDKVTCVSAV